MFRFAFLCFLIAASVHSSSAQTMPELRDELLRMKERDQAVREKCANGSAEQQVECLVQSADEVDRPNTKRINEIFNSSGFPTASSVGVEGVKAFVLLMQHSGDIDLRKKSEAGMKRAFEEKVISPSEYTSFVDRLLVDQGQLQIYGSNFVSQDGKLVMSPVEDMKGLDERRKAIGLPPIAEYDKMMKEIYKLEVLLPSASASGFIARGEVSRPIDEAAIADEIPAYKLHGRELEYLIELPPPLVRFVFAKKQMTLVKISPDVKEILDKHWKQALTYFYNEEFRRPRNAQESYDRNIEWSRVCNTTQQRLMQAYVNAPRGRRKISYSEANATFGFINRVAVSVISKAKELKLRDVRAAH